MKRSIAGIALTILLSSTSLPAAADSAATVMAGPDGGHVVVGRTAATTPLAALHASGRAFGGRFDRAPEIESVAESANGRAAYATFRSVYEGVPVVGVIVAATTSGKTQLVAFADRPDRIRASLGPMLEAFEQKASEPAPGAPAGGAGEPLRTYAFPDDSGSVELPADWTVKSAGQGHIQANGPNGEAALLGVAIGITDPRAGQMAMLARMGGTPILPYDSDPRVVYTEFHDLLARQHGGSTGVTFSYAKQYHVSNWWNPMVIAATEGSKNGPERASGVIDVAPTGNGTFMLALQIMIAPTSRYDREIRTLTSIFNSFKTNDAVIARQTEQVAEYDRAFTNATIANVHAVGDASMANARAAQGAIDRSTSGFVHYLNGTDVVEDMNTGERNSVESDFAQDLSRRDPQKFRVVPMTQYRAGD